MAEFLQSIQEGAEPADGAEPEVRLAVYDSPLAAPRVASLRGREFHAFVGDLATRTYNFGRERGGRIPYIVIREIIENLIHAYFRGAVISILDDGNTIRISDQGPGIPDKEKALQPGFTTATPQMRRLIKGVGSGLPVAREQLAFLGGAIAIDDNRAAQEGQLLLGHGQTRSDSFDQAAHLGCGGRKPWLQRLFLVGDAGPLVRNADGIPVV